MLWLAGDPHDLTGAYLGWLAEQRGAQVERLAEDELGLGWRFEIDPDGKVGVWAGGERLPDPTGVAVRLNPEPTVPDLLELSEKELPVYVGARRAALTALLEALPVPVVNRPTCGRTNGSKPLQMAWLQRLGFDVPRWLVTNDPVGAAEFAAPYDRVVIKSVSGLRSHARLLDDGHLEQLRAGTAPVLLQVYVPGYEVRVHVVEEQAFGTRIDSTEVDYRFDTDHADSTAVAVPDSIAALCRQAAELEGLLLAGLDFRVDPDGRWWCLEMNPVPTFLPYEAMTGHAIGDATLDLLVPERATHDSSPLAARFAALHS